MAHELDTVAIVGCGVIGAGWATHFLAQGYRVIATDPGEGAEARLRGWIERDWPTVTQLGLVDGASPAKLVFTSEVAHAVREAFFIQESGPERLDLKRPLIAAIEAAARPDAIIATSSSGLSVSEIQAGARHPERIVLGHPFNPPHLIPLVEVGGGRETSAAVVERTMAFYAATGKKPIRLRKEVKGHVANRLQVALWREAISLVLRGVASVEDIDIAISHGPGLRWAMLGPFLNLHASGGPGGIRHLLQHLGASQREWAADLGTYPETDDYIEPIARGVDDELAQRDFGEVLRQRDALLVQLLAAKKARPQLP